VSPRTVVPLDGRQADDGPQRLEVDDGHLVVVLRALTTPLVVPLDDVAVVARTRTPADPPLRRTPVLPTAQLQGATAQANLLVVFRRPVRVPAVRVQPGGSLGLSRRRSMSADGLFVDGMWFALDDPDTALEQLAAAGLTVGHDAAPSLAAAVGTSPGGTPEAAVRRRNSRRISALLVASLLGFVALAVGSAFTSYDTWVDELLLGAGLLAFAGGFFGAVWLAFRRPVGGVRPEDRPADEHGAAAP
jgi:hypothetical protein